MSAAEQKRIVIRLPTFSWSFFVDLRFLALVSALAISAGVAYWYHDVRPFISVSGARLEAFSTLLSSDVSGRIVEMGPQEGDLVKKGQMLFSLDKDSFAGKQMQARLRVDEFKEHIEKENGRIGKAMEEYLTAAGFGSEEMIKKQLSMIDEAEKKIAEAKVAFSKAKEELDLVDMQAKKMSLAAPFDGVIVKQFENVGAVVSFGSPVYLLCDRDRLWVEAEIDEKEIGLVSIGTPAKVKLAAYPNKEFFGSVSYIGPTTVSKTTLRPFMGEEKIPVKITLENASVALQPGLSAVVRLKVR